MTSDEQPSVAAEISLDEVMVAMDVVDTLRHDEALVKNELSEGQRREALVRRIQDVYAAQGLAVPEEVIRKGVAALQDDRFTYTTPERTFAVRMAEIYVRRGFYGKWLLALALVGALLYGAYAIPRAIRVARERAQWEAVLQRTVAEETEQILRLDALRKRFSSLMAVPAGDLAATPLLDQADTGFAQAEDLVAQIKRMQAEKRLDEHGLSMRGSRTKSLSQVLKESEAKLDSYESLLQIQSALDRAIAPLAGMELDPDVRTQIDSLKTTIGNQRRAGDGLGARASLDRLMSIISAVNQVYTLRIASGDNERSGVYRLHSANRNVKNYYIIVRAVDENGDPVKVAVEDEELGRTVWTSTFGVRVSESVYNQVRDDKLDNQIIDRPVFAVKARGTRELRYFYEHLGGRITRW